MQATARGKQFVIDHRAFAVMVTIVALFAVAGVVALLQTTSSTTEGPNARDAVVQNQPSSSQTHHPTDRPKSITGVTQLDEATGSHLERIDQMRHFYDAKMARQEALAARVSQRTDLMAFPGHAGFTSGSTSRLDRAEQMARFFDAKMARLEAIESQTSDREIWTAFPGHSGFTIN